MLGILDVDLFNIVEKAMGENRDALRGNTSL